MTKLRKRMLEDMQLRGYSQRTQECYTRSVRQLAQHYNKPPDQITEEELRQYFLHIKNVKKWKRATAEAVQKLARDPKWVGGEIGLLGVAQTWNRDMTYHVHAHFIVPGGGI